MASPHLRVAIPFQPLLNQITDCLSFPAPIYGLVDNSRNIGSVTINAENGTVACVHVGGEAPTLGKSCDNVAEQVVRNLIKRYGVVVEDFTFEKNQMVRKCARLYHIKRAELELAEKEVTKAAQYEALGLSNVAVVKHVSLDYVEVLRVVGRQIMVSVTAIETISFGCNLSIAWLSVLPSRSTAFEGTLAGYACVVGDCCPTNWEAKQTAAKKTIYTLMQMYNFEINDANSDLTARDI